MGFDWLAFIATPFFAHAGIVFVLVHFYVVSPIFTIN